MPPLRVDEVVPAKSPRPNQISSSITLFGQEAKLLTCPAVPFHRRAARERRDSDKAIDRAHEHRGRESLGTAETRALAWAPASPRRYRLPSDETPTGNAASSTSFASARTPPPPPSPSIRCLGSIVGEAPPLTPLAVGAEHRPRSSPDRFHPNRARGSEAPDTSSHPVPSPRCSRKERQRNTDGQRRLFDVLRVGQNTAAVALAINLLPRFHRRRSPAANATCRRSRTPSPELSTSLHPQLTTGQRSCSRRGV
uniref:Uncharacterized protein n=1 Tax=Oryza nivara TaxID=4536 RepID=A0A0E0IDV3_ORYNI